MRLVRFIREYLEFCVFVLCVLASAAAVMGVLIVGPASGYTPLYFPPDPSPFDLYCRHIRAYNRSQPPFQQIHGCR